MVNSRLNGNQFANPYSKLITCAFKCNHDIKFLFDGFYGNMAYYCVKYATRVQKAMKQTLAAIVQRAIERHPLPEDADYPNTVNDTMRRRVIAQIFSMSACQEIGAPLAALYVDRGSPFWYSHHYRKVFLHILVAQL